MLIVVASAGARVHRIPPRCTTRLVPELCSIRTHHRVVNVLRTRMGLRPIPYLWMAERYPARRVRLLTYWTRTHVRTLRRYQAWNRRRIMAPWSTSWYAAAMCVHHYEGAWNANTGNGYYGGLQFDSSFESTYGPEFLAAYGTADHWPPHDQLVAAYRAWRVRGWSPWPNTAAMCGLL